MWNMVAKEMEIPWRAAEAMHWQLGEQEMARRAGVVPFSLSSVALDAQPKRQSSTAAPGSSRKSSSPGSSSSAAAVPPRAHDPYAESEGGSK
jgi:hypothetical protein